MTMQKSGSAAEAEAASAWAVINFDKHEFFTPACLGLPSTMRGLLGTRDSVGGCAFGVPPALVFLLTPFEGELLSSNFSSVTSSGCKTIS